MTGEYADKNYWEKSVIEVCQANKDIVSFLQVVIHMAFTSFLSFVILSVSFLIIDTHFYTYFCVSNLYFFP